MDENQALNKFRTFVQTLQEALKLSFDVSFDERSSFDFSPVEILLESIIDILLLMKQMFDYGSPGPAKNQGLIFSKRETDSLSNPKQIRIRFPREYYWDPNAVKYFTALIETFIEIKKKQPIQQSFVHFAEKTGLRDLPPAPRFRRAREPRFKESKSTRNKHYSYWRRRHGPKGP